MTLYSVLPGHRESVSLPHRVMSSGQRPTPVHLPAQPCTQWLAHSRWAGECFHRVTEHLKRSPSFSGGPRTLRIAESQNWATRVSMVKHSFAGMTPADLTKGKGQLTRHNRVTPGEGSGMMISLFDYLLFSLAGPVRFSWFPQSGWSGDVYELNTYVEQSFYEGGNVTGPGRAAERSC